MRAPTWYRYRMFLRVCSKVYIAEVYFPIISKGPCLIYVYGDTGAYIKWVLASANTHGCTASWHNQAKAFLWRTVIHYRYRRSVCHRRVLEHRIMKVSQGDSILRHNLLRKESISLRHGVPLCICWITIWITNPIGRRFTLAIYCPDIPQLSIDMDKE